MQSPYGGFRILFHRIGDADHSQRLIAQGQEQWGSGLGGDGIGLLLQFGQINVLALQPAAVAQARGLSIQLALHAFAVEGFEAGDIVRRCPLVLRLRHNGFGQRVLRVLFQTGGQGQQPAGIAVGGMETGDGRVTLGNGASLVQDHQIQLAGRLQGVPLANQCAVFGGLSDAHHH